MPLSQFAQPQNLFYEAVVYRISLPVFPSPGHRRYADDQALSEERGKLQAA